MWESEKVAEEWTIPFSILVFSLTTIVFLLDFKRTFYCDVFLLHLFFMLTGIWMLLASRLASSVPTFLSPCFLSIDRPSLFWCFVKLRVPWQSAKFLIGCFFPELFYQYMCIYTFFSRWRKTFVLSLQLLGILWWLLSRVFFLSFSCKNMTIFPEI